VSEYRKSAESKVVRGSVEIRWSGCGPPALADDSGQVVLGAL